MAAQSSRRGDFGLLPFPICTSASYPSSGDCYYFLSGPGGGWIRDKDDMLSKGSELITLLATGPMCHPGASVCPSVQMGRPKWSKLQPGQAAIQAQSSHSMAVSLPRGKRPKGSGNELRGGLHPTVILAPVAAAAQGHLLPRGRGATSPEAGSRESGVCDFGFP